MIINDDSDSEKNEKEEEAEEYVATEYDVNVDRAKFVWELGDQEGHLEAPIDLNISTMTKLELNPLLWFNHDIAPKKIKLTNTGCTVIMSAKWQKERPYLIDGPFLGKYVFSQLHFHWGENEMVGSEHFVDGSRMAMELHAVYFKADYQSQDEALRQRDGLAILVYLFVLQPSANPVLDCLIAGLPEIPDPGDSTRISQRPALVDLTRPFFDDYIMYWGALTPAGHPEATNRMLWLVSREPIGVTEEQIAQFRTLNNKAHEPLTQNLRPLQERQGRSVFHVNPSGKMYSTLLLIPREPPPPLMEPDQAEKASGE